MYQRFGVMQDYFADRPVSPSDLGRYNVTGKEEDRHVFKVIGGPRNSDSVVRWVAAHRRRRYHPMSKTKRTRYSAEFKAKVALEAIKGEQTISELGSRYGLHPNMITNWKRQAIDNMAEAFSSKAEKARTADDAQIKDLHAKIGQLTVERDFLAKAFGR